MFGAVTGDTKKNLMEGFKVYLPLGYICIQSHVVNERLKIQGVVHSALDIFLGNTSAGQKRKRSTSSICTIMQSCVLM
jgi:hypothetical protein